MKPVLRRNWHKVAVTVIYAGLSVWYAIKADWWVAALFAGVVLVGIGALAWEYRRDRRG